ncbi:MAG: DUF4390 domain-containing protein [Proteobacteria bacterium]|nr:DUF4390 domain-containing protein [Pseudomonadota bacterium]
MRWWKSTISIFFCTALVACAPAPGAFVVRAATIESGTLTVRSVWQPAGPVLDALDHGIELPFVISAQIRTPNARALRIHRHVQLRYFPLSRQYQVRDVEDATTRSYAARALALAAMENLRLRLPADDAAGAMLHSVRIALDRDALPGALRLPALLQSAWHMDSETWTWHAQAG